MVVGVLIVEGADGIGARRQIVEGDGDRPGACPDPPLRVGLIALQELGRAGVKPDKHIALGSFQTVDRDDDACGGCRAGGKNQRGGES